MSPSAFPTKNPSVMLYRPERANASMEGITKRKNSRRSLVCCMPVPPHRVGARPAPRAAIIAKARPFVKRKKPPRRAFSAGAYVVFFEKWKVLYGQRAYILYFLKNREYCVWYISPFRVKSRACKGGGALCEPFSRQGGAFTDAACRLPPAVRRPASAAPPSEGAGGRSNTCRKVQGAFQYLSEGALAAQAPKNVMVMSPISVAATRVRVPPKRSAMLLEPMFAVTPMV